MENFYKKVQDFINKDPRYKLDAYDFVMRALWFTQKKLNRQGHISGQELLFGIKDFILDEYGPMAKTVLQHWGIRNTQDFGEIVFNMIGMGLLRKTEEDSLDDFKDVYNFNEALDFFKNEPPKRKTGPKRRYPARKGRITPAIKPNTKNFN